MTTAGAPSQDMSEGASRSVTSCVTVPFVPYLPPWSSSALQLEPTFPPLQGGIMYSNTHICTIGTLTHVCTVLQSTGVYTMHLTTDNPYDLLTSSFIK